MSQIPEGFDPSSGEIPEGFDMSKMPDMGNMGGGGKGGMPRCSIESMQKGRE